MPTGPSDLGNSSIEVTSSQAIVVCVKMVVKDKQCNRIWAFNVNGWQTVMVNGASVLIGNYPTETQASCSSELIFLPASPATFPHNMGKKSSYLSTCPQFPDGKEFLTQWERVCLPEFMGNLCLWLRYCQTYLKVKAFFSPSNFKWESNNRKWD